MVRDSGAAASAAAALEAGRPFMERALALARERLGAVSPRPAVGAVVVRDGQQVAAAATEPGAGRHAERFALELAGNGARGADLYVSLEPCAHFGLTPPCADAIISSGIARVFAAVRDPNPVSGDGVAVLRQAGVQVHLGLLAEAAAEINQGFFKWVETGRPFVTAKWAMSLDGKMATHGGEPRYISGEDSRLTVHAMRRAADAILVGVGTVLADDPLLTSRLPGGSPTQPLRIVLDSTARTPPQAAMLREGTPGKTLIVTGAQAAPGRLAGRVAALQAAGAEVLALDGSRGVDLQALLDELGRRGVLNLLVEGGAAVLASFFEADLVDRVEVFLAPMVIGGAAAPGALAGWGLDGLMQAKRPLRSSVEVRGADVHVTAVLHTFGSLAGGEESG